LRISTLTGGSRSRCGTTDVEGAHGQLRAWLTDRLRSDDAHRLADVDQACHGPDRGRSSWRRRHSGVEQVSGERTLT
jgi:hypothetical protein